jgi:hypothetical protein
MIMIEKIETVIWFDEESGYVLGRELDAAEKIELTEETLIKLIDDKGFSIVVRGDPGYRHYVNLLAPEDYLDEGFRIPTYLPGEDRLWCALNNAHYQVLRTMDGKFTLEPDLEHWLNNDSLEAEIEETGDGKFKILKSLDDDYDIVASESGYRIVEKEKAE